jgi:flagellar motor switch protein FliG
MGIYTRFKRNPEGLRQLVELLEAAPKARRQKMIDAGLREDPEYTERAEKYIMIFEDVLGFDDLVLAELVSKAPPRITAMAISTLDASIKNRFLKCARPPNFSEIRNNMDVSYGKREVGGAQLRLVVEARGLEKAGLINLKRIPTSIG